MREAQSRPAEETVRLEPLYGEHQDRPGRNAWAVLVQWQLVKQEGCFRGAEACLNRSVIFFDIDIL